MTSHTASASPFKRVLRTIQFHDRNEQPVLHLAVSRECIEWLISLIPPYDNARKTLQAELDALPDELQEAPK